MGDGGDKQQPCEHHLPDRRYGIQIDCHWGNIVIYKPSLQARVTVILQPRWRASVCRSGKKF
jgi:hypothetical protein